MKRFAAFVLSMAMTVSSLSAMVLAEDKDNAASEETSETIVEDTEDAIEETTAPSEVSREPDGEIIADGTVKSYNAGENDKSSTDVTFTNRYWDPVQKKVISEDKTIHYSDYVLLTDVIEDGNVRTDAMYLLVTEDTTIKRLRIRSNHPDTNANVGLIVYDGVTLTCEEGIICEENNTLRIYGVSPDVDKEGKIVATGDKSAGIGCMKGEPGWATGTINIYGCNITATGSDWCAGIGGGSTYGGGTINIFGGNIEAKGGQGAAGIGGGFIGNGGTISIYGGTITAEGGCSTKDGEGGAGIGGGYKNNGGTITINGGTIVATSNFGAGIGGGGSADGGNIEIAGGTVRAFSTGLSAAIGSGYKYLFEGTIVISDGTVEATARIPDGYSSSHGASIGAGSGGVFKGKISFTGGSTTCMLIDGKGSERDGILFGPGTDEVKTGDFNGKIELGDVRVGLSNKTQRTYAAADERNDYLKAVAYRLFIESCGHHTIENGLCTLCGYNASSVFGEKVEGYQVSLEGDIGVNFYMTLPADLAASDTAYLLFTLPNGDTHEVPVKDAKNTSDGNEYLYIFKCHIAAKEMTQPIKAQIIDGNCSGALYSFTVKDYADYLLKHHEIQDFAKAAPLVKALLNYGAAAQEYFGVEPDSLANEGYKYSESELNVTIPDTYRDYDMNVSDELVTFAGSSLSLKSETTLSLYFKSSGKLTFKYDTTDVDTKTIGGYQIARISGINASDLGHPVRVEIAIDGEGSYYIEYCPMTYCYKVLNGGSDDKLQNVCKTLYLYNQAAKKYSL